MSPFNRAFAFCILLAFLVLISNELRTCFGARCGLCHEEGHNRRTCPNSVPSEAAIEAAETVNAAAVRQRERRDRLSEENAAAIRVVDLLAHQQRASAMTQEARAGHRVGNQESQQQRRGAMSPEASAANRAVDQASQQQRRGAMSPEASAAHRATDQASQQQRRGAMRSYIMRHVRAGSSAQLKS